MTRKEIHIKVTIDNTGIDMDLALKDMHKIEAIAFLEMAKSSLLQEKGMMTVKFPDMSNQPKN